MSVDRKSFLKLLSAGGMGLFLGGSMSAKKWIQRGVSLVQVERSSLVMGSIAQFKVIAGKEKDGYEAIRRAVTVFRELDSRLSMYNKTSEMGQLEVRAGKEAIALSDDALRVLKYAKEMWQITSGRFDVTIEPAMEEWGFRRDPASEIERPTDEELRKLEQLVGSDKLLLEGGRARLLKEGMGIDLGGIAGGYALDRAIAQMKKLDVAAAFINFSGDIHCFGTPMESEGWPVHIYNPATNRPIPKPVVLRNEALSTSGAYQNRRHSSRRESWGHLLMPGSARPVQSEGSVTAIHPSAMTADAWSTAGYLGAERPEALRWIVI